MVKLGTQHWLENATSAVHGNAAVVELNTPNSRFDGLQSTLAEVTWFDARGHVIRHATDVMHE
jgi:hypothetical protein